MASAIDDIPYIKFLVADLNSAVNGPNGLDQSSRARALQRAKELTGALETPQNAIAQQRLMPCTFACTKIATDLDLFNILAEDKDKPKTATELGKIAGAEPLLIVRIMRVMTAMSFAKEVAESTYACTTKTLCMTEPPNIAGMNHVYNITLRSVFKMSDFFKTNAYKNPTNTGETPFQFGWETNDTMFAWMQKRPEALNNFNTFMQGSRADRLNWWDWFTVREQLLDGFKDESEAVLMVDVGGGRGQDLMSFKQKFPEAPGRLILQDQPHVIDSARLSNDVEKMSYDFFSPQPIKDARVYFEHYILHDWDDEQCVQILKNIASAMTRGYSKLYLNEWILPNIGCSLYEAALDMQMMLLLAGMERTQSQWQELLKRAGLRLVKFWLSPGFGEGIVEAAL